MGVDINYGLLRTPDFFQTMTQGFEAGRQIAKQRKLEHAFQSYVTDPTAAIAEATSVDPQTGFALADRQRQDQQRQGNLDLAGALSRNDNAGAIAAAAKLGPEQVMAVQQSVRQMTADQRAQLQQTNEALAGVLVGIKHASTDPAERLRMAQHLAQTHPELGIKPESITPDDVSDQGIDTHVATAMTLKDILAREDAQNKPIVVPEGGSVVTQGSLMGGQGQPAAPAAVAPAAAPGATPQPHGGIYDTVAQIAAQNGAKPEETAYLRRLAQVESAGDPGAQNGSSTGLFQFHPSTFQGAGGGNINDPADQTRAALALSRQYRAALQSRGLPTDDATTYLMHQQGPGGGMALLTAPSGESAIAALTSIYGNAETARKAIVGNGGSPDMTAGQFVDMWRQRWAGQHSQSYQVASNGQAPAAPTAHSPVLFSNPKPTGHASTPAELKAAGLPEGTAAWTDATGKPTPYSKDFQAPGSGPSNLTGDDYLTKLPPGRQAEVRAIVEGRLQPPTGAALRSPAVQSLLNDVAQYQPGFDLVNWQTRAATRRDFTSGKSAQNITALNTVIGHLDDLDHAITGLGNYDFPANNWAAHIIARGTGTDARIRQFETAKTAVANELTRVFRGTGGAEADIQAWQKQLNDASSPKALRSVVKTMADLIHSRIEALGEQYNQGMGTAVDPIRLLTPEKAHAFARMSAGIAPENDKTPSPPAGGTQVSAGAPYAAAVSPQPARPAQVVLPPQARSKLQKGYNTTFSVGGQQQTWTLDDQGNPKRLR